MEGEIGEGEKEGGKEGREEMERWKGIGKGERDG